MSFFNFSDKRRDGHRQPPEFCTQLTDNLGIAVWKTGNDYEVKLGQCFEDTDRRTGNKRLVVRQVVPLRHFGEAVVAMEIVSRVFGRDRSYDVADDLRASLTDLAARLEAATALPSGTDSGLNGPTNGSGPFAGGAA